MNSPALYKSKFLHFGEHYETLVWFVGKSRTHGLQNPFKEYSFLNNFNFYFISCMCKLDGQQRTY